MKEIIPFVVEHLTILEQKFNFYFLSLNPENSNCGQNTFIKISFDIYLKLCEELAFMSSDQEDWKVTYWWINFSTLYELGFFFFSNWSKKAKIKTWSDADFIQH